MDAIIWTLVILLLGIIIYFSIGAYAALTLTKIGDHPQYSEDPAMYGMEFQNVFLYSREDNLKIAAWYIPKPGANRAIILVHGRDASKQNAISGNFPKLAFALHQAGFTVLMIDLRGHGESEGKRYTWGVFERRDVLGAVDFLLFEGYLPGNIGTLGISLGGAAVIGAASQEPAIGCVILDSTFADLQSLAREKWRKESGMPLFFLPGVNLMWNLMYHFKLEDVNPALELAGMPDRPILIMHSRDDEMVAFRHAEKLSEAVPSAGFVEFEKCSHAEIFRDAPQKYLDAVLNFLQNYWSGSNL